MPRVKLFDENEVLEKAMHLFWKQGYSATSVQDLVHHLGINRASIYDTFGDKEQLFLRAFEHYRTINKERIIAFFVQQKEVKKGFRKLFELAIQESLQDKDRKGCFVVNTTTEMVPGDDYIHKILNENRKSFEKIFLQYLQKGENEGQFSSGKNLKAIASLLFTLYSGFRVILKVNTNKKELIQSIDQALLLLD